MWDVSLWTPVPGRQAEVPGPAARAARGSLRRAEPGSDVTTARGHPHARYSSRALRPVQGTRPSVMIPSLAC